MGDAMSQDEMTNDEFDSQLSRLFAEKNEPLRSDEFMEQVLSRLEREQRLQWIRRGLLMLAIMLLAGIIAPWVVQVTMRLFITAGQVAQLPGVDITISVVTMLIGAASFFRARKRSIIG